MLITGMDYFAIVGLCIAPFAQADQQLKLLYYMPLVWLNFNSIAKTNGGIKS